MASSWHSWGSAVAMHIKQASPNLKPSSILRNLQRFRRCDEVVLTGFFTRATPILN